MKGDNISSYSKEISIKLDFQTWNCDLLNNESMLSEKVGREINNLNLVSIKDEMTVIPENSQTA